MAFSNFDVLMKKNVYSLRVHLQAHFPDNLNLLLEEFNSQMSKVRISTEWLFNEMIKYFAFLDFKKNFKIGLSPVVKMYRVYALLTELELVCIKHKPLNFSTLTHLLWKNILRNASFLKNWS